MTSAVATWCCWSKTSFRFGSFSARRSPAPATSSTKRRPGTRRCKHASQSPPDLVILDLGLPDMDGQEVLQQLREWLTAPIIVLSARDQEQQKITALDHGADDYLTKPFSTGELLARIRAALRHAARVAATSRARRHSRSAT